MDKKELAVEIAKRLQKNNPSPKSDLNFENAREMLIATALSAQTTDKKVNEITSKLFKKYDSWEKLATADLQTLQNDIKGVNFHKGKAERLIKAAQMLIEDFGGKVPKTMEKLTKIPGVARKSANVIMQEVWDVSEGIVVDTHVTRLTNDRWHLTDKKDAVKIERDLMNLVPKESWRNFSGNVVLHGRYVCTARKPKCSECFLNDICPSSFLDS